MAFPQTALEVRAEILVDGQFVNITSKVRGLDVPDGEVKISRGRGDERGVVSAGKAKLSLNNRDGLFSSRNPNSAYFGKIGRNTPAHVIVRPHWTAGTLRDAVDTFTRSSASTWGTSDTGGAWEHFGTNTVLNSDFQVSGTEGTMAIPPAGAAMRRSQLLGPSTVEDCDLAVTFKAPQATGSAINVGLTMRGTSSAYDRCQVSLETTNAVTAKIYDRFGLLLGSATVSGLTHTGTGQPLRIRARRVGRWLMMRCWIAANTEPSTWDVTAFDEENLFGITAGKVGVRIEVDGSNTNARTLTVTFDNFASVTEMVRMAGEIPSWPQQWDKSGTDVWTTIEIAGVMRRLNQGAKALNSPVRRAVEALLPDAYWPMEDGSDSTSIASALSGGQAMTIFDESPSFKATGVAGSDGVTQFRDFTGVRGRVTQDSSSTGWTLMFVMNIPEVPLADTQIIAINLVGGTYSQFVLTLFPGTVPDSIGIEILNANGSRAVLFDLPFQANTLLEPYTRDLLMSMTARQNGANMEYEFSLEDIVNHEGEGRIGGSTAGTLGYIDSVNISNAYSHTDWQYSHIAVWNRVLSASWGSLDWSASFLSAARGYLGETAGDRFERLCDEEGIYYATINQLLDTARMGPQTAKTLLDLLQECTDTDQGILCETRSYLGLQFIPRYALYNQTPVELSYTSNHLSGELIPTDDDQHIHNDVTAERSAGASDGSLGGSTRRAVQETGPLNVQSPRDDPQGVGRYSGSNITVNVEDDDQLLSIAGWAKHLGTWDEARYPKVSVQLQRSVWSNDTSSSSQFVGLETAAMLSIADLPAWLPPDDVRLMIQGYNELISQFRWEIDHNTTPGDPYTVAVFNNATNAKFDTSGCELAVAATSSATSLNVVTDEGMVLWTEDAAEFPFDWRISGERVTATAISHTAIAFRSVGAVAHGNNASVAPGAPAGRVAGDLLTIFAAIRNSGTGTVNTPTGYRLLGGGGTSNIALFGRIATNTAADLPTVSFTGGVANADTSAQMTAWSGLFTDINKVFVKEVTELNSSAQDINFPGVNVPRNNCLVLACGWKQDDWTSVATVSGFTEIAEPSTITGNDQGIVWDYVVQTTKAVISGGSFVVTGGAAAISRSLTVVIGSDTQTATVTRSVNGISKAQVAGESVSLWTPARFAR